MALAICECPFWRFFFSFWRFGALAILAKKKKAVEEFFKPASVGSHPNKRNGVQEEVMCKVGFGCAVPGQKIQRMLFIRELDRKRGSEFFKLRGSRLPTNKGHEVSAFSC